MCVLSKLVVTSKLGTRCSCSTLKLVFTEYAVDLNQESSQKKRNASILHRRRSTFHSEPVGHCLALYTNYISFSSLEALLKLSYEDALASVILKQYEASIYVDLAVDT